LKINFRSNPRWPTADQSAKVASVFDPARITAAVGIGKAAQTNELLTHLLMVIKN